MTARLVMSCDGHRNGMPCRGFLTTRASSPDAGRAVAMAAGWSTRWNPVTWPAPSTQQDFCPSPGHEEQQ